MVQQLRFIDGQRFDHPLGKVVCVGRNYAEHAKELNNPVPTEPILFIKPATSVVPLSEPLRIPEQDCHYETELAILIGKPLTQADASQAQEAIAGYGLALDLTKRALQSKLKEKSHPWEIAKSFDGACPLSDFAPASEINDMSSLNFTLHINGEPAQQGQVSDMITPIVPLLVFMSQHFTLMPGDVVLTGTPKGVGELHSGDKLALQMAGKYDFSTSVI